MKIKLTKIYVDDQDKALAFYTEKLGFVKKADFSNGPYRWLTIASAEEPNGTELQLERNSDPAAKALQESQKANGAPGFMFYSDDLQGEHDRIAAKGVTFAMPPTKTTGSIIAQIDDTCGNLIQLTQLTWGG